jgi:hypothetical protein
MAKQAHIILIRQVDAQILYRIPVSVQLARKRRRACADGLPVDARQVDVGHPANINESAAMGAIQPLPVTYKPNLSQDIINKGILSDVQLEAVTYAGQSHSQTLPNCNTRGFFLGDGTGVGKGRTITGVILDNFNQGSKKAVWLSGNKGLVPDAKRDVAALFGNSDLVTEFEGGKKADKSLSNDEAILFTTYSSLSKGFDQSGSNFEKIVNWLGKDFDGVIVFDEAHNMANSFATKGNRGVKKSQSTRNGGACDSRGSTKRKNHILIRNRGNRSGEPALC